MSTRFHLTLPGSLSREPVLHALGDRFGLVTNIRRAGIEEDSGWVILELEGSEEEVARALEWLSERGVQVARIED